MRYSALELRDILKAWIAVSIMFTIAFSGIGKTAILAFPMFLLTAGIGFVLHELAHKYVAQRHNCLAEFRANTKMLILGIIISFFGIVFAAPGGVFVHGSQKHSGKISAAGPATNIIIAAMFALLFFLTAGTIKTVAGYGWIINSWLAAFNMIPAMPFDGQKILRWSKAAYFTMLASSILLTVASFSIAKI